MTATVPGHDASLTHFSLPNGLPAFYVLNSRGERIDRVPQDIARRSHAGRTGVRVGLDCLGCHAGGPVLGGDDPKLAALRAFADSDRRLNQAAAAAVGLLHDMKADGVEPITAHRYPSVAIMDVRADKSFKFGERGKLTGQFDVFNLTNSGVPTTVRLTSVNFNEVTAILSPRVIRLGVRFDF